MGGCVGLVCSGWVEGGKAFFNVNTIVPFC